MGKQNINTLYLEASNSLSSFLASPILSLTTPILLWSTGKTGRVWSPSLARVWQSFLSIFCSPGPTTRRSDRPCPVALAVLPLKCLVVHHLLYVRDVKTTGCHVCS